MSASQVRLRALRATVPETTAAQARALQQSGALLVDVREPDEVAQGSPKGSARIVRGFLELKIEQAAPDLDRKILTICAGGSRSLFAAADLEALGYSDVSSVAGGFSAWKAAGLPVEAPPHFSASERERYGRHLAIPEVGEEGQARLQSASVLLVGAGGLGSPAALYLAAAGVGRLGLVDDDVVDRSNLQRQVLHSDDRVGGSKVESARLTLEALNPDIRIDTFATRLDSSNVEDIFADYEIVVDGTDNFATRYLINDACVKLGLPNVHGSVFRFEGQVSVFWPGRRPEPGPCYRCLYPEPPPADLAPSCAEAGVLGAVPGVVGVLQAVETIKLVVGVGEPLVGRLLQYDALTQTTTRLRTERNVDCPYCGEDRSFPGYVNYAAVCAAPVTA